MTDQENARKKVQELLSQAHAKLLEARDLAQANGLTFTFGEMGWSPDEDNLPESIDIDWQPSDGYTCW